MLMLLHVPIQCVMESVDGDDDIAAKVSFSTHHVALLLATFGVLTIVMCVGIVVGFQRDLCQVVCLP